MDVLGAVEPDVKRSWGGKKHHSDARCCAKGSVENVLTMRAPCPCPCSDAFDSDMNEPPVPVPVLLCVPARSRARLLRRRIFFLFRTAR